VLGLEVEVNDAVVVRGSERLGGLADDIYRIEQVQPLIARQHVFEALAFQVLHHEVDRFVGGCAEVGHVDDIRVPNLARGARLVQELVDRALSSGKAVVKDLDRDGPAQHHVLALVDDPHPTFTEDAVDLVVA
jgi:hypothetical protein